ncbi:hypothetical protein [uncultured Demequina sp.]|uniref:hypothetical protein n=1 Tax=uncultured Demequina sp. TaxID=693499 RepID=UPI0025CF0D73|nr:hypothetical protein [uncultured Demequina sp.]
MNPPVRDERSSRRGDDSGLTVVELVVSMGIFAAVIVVFMTAVASMSSSTVRTQAASDATSALRTVYQRLDKEVRYASEINPPGVVGDDHYVEYLIPESTGTGDPLCVQWRVDASEAELQRRTWTPGDASSVSAWATMLTDLRNDLTDPDQQPFERRRAGVDSGIVYLRQSLHVYLDTGLGDELDAEGGQLDVTMVANNTSTSSVTNGSTGDTVCLVGGVQRP